MTDTKPNPKELIRQMPALIERAAADGMSLTHYLERHVDPSHRWTGDDRSLGAFGRLLASTGVIWSSDPARGVWADKWEDLFLNPDTRALLPEWGANVWRAARSIGGYQPQIAPQARFVINQDDEKLGTAMRPYADAAAAFQQTIAPTLPLAELVGMTTPVEGNAYRRAFLDTPTPANVRWVRIAETADIPRSTVKTHEQAVRLFKYGRAFELSYEALRNSPVDKVGFFIAQAANQVENDRVAQAIDVLINGDGNAGTSATVFNHSTLDTGTTLTYRGWLMFKAQFASPYQITHVIARKAEGVNLQALNIGTQNPFLAQVGEFLGAGSVQRINEIFDGVVRLGESDQVPAGSYLGFDRRFALERLTEVGSDIQETVNFIERQTRLLTFTETEGYGILDGRSAKLLNLV